jgi:hypothetical protein
VVRCVSPVPTDLVSKSVSASGVLAAVFDRVGRAAFLKSTRSGPDPMQFLARGGRDEAKAERELAMLRVKAKAGSQQAGNGRASRIIA